MHALLVRFLPYSLFVELTSILIFFLINVVGECACCSPFELYGGH